MSPGKSRPESGEAPREGPGRVARAPARDLRERRARRETEGRDRVPVVGSAAIHGVALVLVWLTTLADPRPMPVETYEITIVSAPSPVTMEEPEPPAPAEELVVETPDPEIPEPEETTPLTDEPEPEPEELTTEPPADEPPPEPAEEETPPADPDPEETETAGEDINVRMEGLRRDYPAYYANIIRQINRCFRWRQGGRLEVLVRFVIRGDGTVSDLDIVEGSGNLAFDTEALGAVECAGQGRLGPLPDDLPYDQLPVQFRFSPPSR